MPNYRLGRNINRTETSIMPKHPPQLNIDRAGLDGPEGPASYYIGNPFLSENSQMVLSDLIFVPYGRKPPWFIVGWQLYHL